MRGQTIRVAVGGISIQGRAAQGVTVFRVDEGERVVSVERIADVSDDGERMRASWRRTRIGLYPGTFDPVTLGHLDIIKRAVKLVDHLVIGVATNASKKPMFTLEERVAMMRREAEPLARGPRHHRGAALRHAAGEIRRTRSAPRVIIRGLRAVSDFEYEFQMVAMNQRLNKRDRDRLPDGRSAPPGHRLAAGEGNRPVWAATSRRSPRPLSPNVSSNAARN